MIQSKPCRAKYLGPWKLLILNRNLCHKVWKYKKSVWYGYLNHLNHSPKYTGKQEKDTRAGNCFRAAAHLSDTTAMPQVSWCQCCCGLPQYFAHTTDGVQATAGQRCRWILTHNLTLLIQALSHHCSNYVGCNIHGGAYPTWFIHGDVCPWQFPSFSTGRSVLPFLN